MNNTPTTADLAATAATAIATTLRTATDACAVRAISRYDREARFIVANNDMSTRATLRRLQSMVYAVNEIARVY